MTIVRAEVFWQIYVERVEVKANGDQHEILHEQEETPRQPPVRFISLQLLKAKVPAIVTKMLAIPWERTPHPI